MEMCDWEVNAQPVRRAKEGCEAAFKRLNSQERRQEPQWLWEITFPAVIDDPKEGELQRAESQTEKSITLQKCGGRKDAGEDNTEKLQQKAEAKELGLFDASRQIAIATVNPKREPEKSSEKNTEMRVVLRSRVVLEENLLNAYNIKHWENEQIRVPRSRPASEINVYLSLLNAGGDWIADESFLKLGLRGSSKERQDTNLSTTSGSTTPTHASRTTSINCTNGSLPRVDTTWNGIEWEDANGGLTWGPQLFFFERESTTSTDHRPFSAGNCHIDKGCEKIGFRESRSRAPFISAPWRKAKEDLQGGWGQAINFTETLLRDNRLEEESGHVVQGSHSPVSSGTQPHDNAHNPPTKEEKLPSLVVDEGAHSVCVRPCVHPAHYASFLRDTEFIESVLRATGVA